MTLAPPDSPAHPPLTCAVTGGTGYVGSVLLHALRARGWRALSLQRSPSEQPDVRRFSLDQSAPSDLFRDVNVLVHCAYDFRPIDASSIYAVNVEGSMRLFRAARECGVKRLILISTLSAFEGCKSLYGKAKLQLEQQSAPLGVIAVRPGLVWGDRDGGMMAALRKLAALPLFTPMVGLGNQLQYLAHETDLGNLIVRLAADDLSIGGPIPAACDQPQTLRQILNSLARSAGKSKLMLPIPWRLIWLGLKTLETVGLRPRTRSDSLVSLMTPTPRPDFSLLHRCRVPFRPFVPTPPP